MARPKAKELTDSELEIMHVFWDLGETSAPQVRDELESRGRELAYTTVATLIKILVEKGFLKQTGNERPFTFQAVRSFDEVSRNMLGDVLDKVFGGSREQLLVSLLSNKKLSRKEKQAIEDIIRKGKK